MTTGKVVGASSRRVRAHRSLSAGEVVDMSKRTESDTPDNSDDDTEDDDMDDLAAEQASDDELESDEFSLQPAVAKT